MKAHVLHVPGAAPERDAAVQVLAQVFDLCVHADPERNGVVWNWAQMMDCMAKNDKDQWSIQLNDDAVPLAAIDVHLRQALWYSPRPILGLAWQGKTRGAKPFGRNVPYSVGPNLLHGVSIAYHRDHTAPCARFAERAARTDYPYDDVLSCTYAQRIAGFDPALVARSLFGVLDTKSLIGSGRYPSALHTIEQPGPAWRRSFVQDNHLANGHHLDEIMEMVGKA